MGTLTVDYITNRSGSVQVPVRELRVRVIKRYESTYASQWNNNTGYSWVPGSYVDFTPLRSDSTIVYTWRAPFARVSGSSHAISHWRFYAAGINYMWHCESGNHIEDGCVFRWEVPSWGTNSQRIGYQNRAYSDNNHEVRFYYTDYWNGQGSNQTPRGQLIVEEIAGG